MPIVATSREVVFVGSQIDAGVVSALVSYSGGYPVGMISNHAEPSWFQKHFANSNVAYVHNYGRQNGGIIKSIATATNSNAHDVIVLAATDTDLQMGKNGGALLVAAGWANNPKLKSLGIEAKTPAELLDMLNLVDGWLGGWRVKCSAHNYKIFSLADLSTIHQPPTQQVFGQKVTNAVKNGGGCLNALLVLTARSLLQDGIGDKTLWGVYPSSSSNNTDNEVLSDFTHRLRTTVSRAHHAKRGIPLFIRHTPSVKRSSSKTVNRLDPSNQIETIHINPEYRTSIVGKTVVVIDDCTTYGVSFGVAAAFLNKAGAKEVIGVALGKFGNQLHSYDIDITSDPFLPVKSGGYKLNSRSPIAVSNSTATQANLHMLIP